MALSRPGSGWEPLCERALGALGASVPDGFPHATSRLLDLVCEWNARIDLTAARSAEELVDLFIADAAVIAREASAPDGERWVDVGSGAGAPAIPLALLLPGLGLTLVEPRDKRVAFLRSALGVLGRGDVGVRRGRSQDVPAGEHQVALSRATLSPDEWLAEGARLATRAVWVLLARGEAPTLAGWRAEADVTYAWPLTGAERRALRYVK